MTQAPTYRNWPNNRNWYELSAPTFPPAPTLKGDHRADVCVIGGGYTGLMAALELAERGFDVVLLEGRRVGWGASGRNGGQIINGFNLDQTTIEGMVGADDARRLWDLNLEATGLLAERVARHDIACDLTWGFAMAALKPRHMAAAAAHVEELTGRYGYPHLRLLDRAEMRGVVASDAYLGGVHDAASGHFHPLAYARGLATAAVAAGVRLFENSPVTRLDHGRLDHGRLDHGGPVVAHTAEGRVTARFAVIATNAYGAGLEDRHLSRWVMPVATFIIATEPLGAERAAALIPANQAISDMNFSLNYFRRSSDHRLLFGGGVSYTGMENPPGLALGMRAKMLRVFPQLHDVGVEHVWGGRVAITVNRMPRLGRIAPNIVYAHGYSGHGAALAGFSGKLAAEALTGTAERFDVFTRIPHRRFPGSGSATARTAILTLAMLWARLRDAL